MNLFRATRTPRLALLILVALAAPLLAASCDDGGSGTPSTSTATGVFGVVTSVDGAPVAGVTVTAGGASATTDASGHFELRLDAGPSVVQVADDGYAHTAYAVEVYPDEASALDIVLLPLSPAVQVDATTGGEVTGPRGARLELPPSALVDASGQPVTGMVDVHLTPLDPSGAELAAAPGDFTADSGAGTALLESFGMIDITVRDAGGADLDVAPGMSVAIAMPAIDGAPDAVPLWSFDEARARWVQEGELTLAADGTYGGAVSHFSFWNADRELETTCVSGTTVDAETGAPLVGARVSSRGVDYAGTAAATSGAGGRWAVPARVDSQVVVLAAHEAGGGVERTVETGSTVVALPPSPDDPGCVDSGQWPVRRGVIETVGGEVISCDAPVFADFRRCQPLMTELGDCLQPSGTCENVGSGLFDIDYEWENGARLSTEIDTDTSQATTTYYGPGGTLCGSTTSSGSSLTLEMADGRTASAPVSFDRDSGTVTYGCTDGSSVTLTQAEQERIGACGGGADTEQCSDDVGLGQLCDTSAECGEGKGCCFGLCTATCSLGFSCTADSECDGANNEVCCASFGNLCRDRFECNPGTCDTDADCEAQGRTNQPCCDGQCLNDREFCAGNCELDSQCVSTDEPDAMCCPDETRTWCASTVESCYGGSVCTADADCGGADSSLVCCPDSSGGDSSCETPDDCYGGTPCTADADCGPGTICCDNPAFGGELLCFSAEQCNLFAPCTSEADCVGGNTCCNDVNFMNQCAPVENCTQ